MDMIVHSSQGETNSRKKEHIQFDNRQPRPEIISPPKIPRKENPLVSAMAPNTNEPTYGNYNLFESTTPVNHQSVYMPPVSSTTNSGAMLARPNSASLTEICSSDEEDVPKETIQKPTQTPVVNYVH